jgi:hypothetical protein
LPRLTPPVPVAPALVLEDELELVVPGVPVVDPVGVVAAGAAACVVMSIKKFL